MRPAILLASLLALHSPGLAQATEKLTPELLWQLARVSDLQLSPDGATLLYTVQSSDLAANKGRKQLVFLGTDGKSRRLLPNGANDWHGRFSPDGKRVAFLSTRAGAPQVFVQELSGASAGTALKVTSHAGGVDGFLWSPSGDRFAFTGAVKIDKVLGNEIYKDLPLANARVYDSLMVRHWDEWKDGSYSHLFVVPLAGGEAKDLMAGERCDTPLKPFGGIEQVAWTQSGEHLCYTAKKVTDPAASTNSDLFLVSVDGGPAKNFTPDDPGYDQDPLFSPDGNWIAWHSMARPGFESDKNRLIAIDRKTKRRIDLTESFDQSTKDFCWTSDSKSIVFTSDVHGTTQLYQVSLDGGGPSSITGGRHEIASPCVSPDGATIYALRQQTERPFEVVAFPRAGGTAKTLSDENGAMFARLALPEVRERWTKTGEGRRVHSWVVLPPGFDENKKYPMLLFCQGGPQSMVGQWFSFRWNFHVMAAHGYVVLGVNRSGLPGFGQKWNDQISRDWGGQAMSDLLAATDDLFTEPWIDKKRTAAVGASFGGYTVYWLMGHDQPDRFCAMVAHCGVMNLEAMSLATEELFFTNWDIGRYWESDAARQACERFSPHSFIGEWSTPLLVIHGEKDYRVPVTEGLSAFTAAQIKGVPSRFLHLPDAGHWVSTPQDSVLWYREFFRFLDTYCKP